jgi:hypothetical protein
VPASAHLPDGSRSDWEMDDRAAQHAPPPVIENESCTFSNTPVSRVQFLELCLNTDDPCQTLGKINVSRVTSDAGLFGHVRRRYREIRGFRIKKHFLLRPISIQFVLWPGRQTQSLDFRNAIPTHRGRDQGREIPLLAMSVEALPAHPKQHIRPLLI